MHTLNIAGDDSVAWVADEVSGAEILAFAVAGKVFGRARLMPLAGDEPFDYVLGPFVHVGALTDAFGIYLSGVGAIAGQLRIATKDKVAPAPVAPALPGYRKAGGQPMHPAFAGAVLLRIQECLDAGDEALAAALRLEKDYAGERLDETGHGVYARGLAVSLGSKPQVSETAEFIRKLEAAAVTQPIVPPAPAATPELLIPLLSASERQQAEAKLFELPVIARRPSLRMASVQPGATTARFPIGGDRPSRLTARIPIDWSGLPVRVVEHRVTDEQSLLRADLVKRKRMHA